MVRAHSFYDTRSYGEVTVFFPEARMVTITKMFLLPLQSVLQDLCLPCKVIMSINTIIYVEHHIDCHIIIYSHSYLVSVLSTVLGIVNMAVRKQSICLTF